MRFGYKHLKGLLPFARHRSCPSPRPARLCWGRSPRPHSWRGSWARSPKGWGEASGRPCHTSSAREPLSAVSRFCSCNSALAIVTLLNWRQWVCHFPARLLPSAPKNLRRMWETFGARFLRLSDNRPVVAGDWQGVFERASMHWTGQAMHKQGWRGTCIPSPFRYQFQV